VPDARRGGTIAAAVRPAAPSARELPRWARVATVALVVVATIALRIRGVSHHFWLMGDQVRDWAIALGPFASLPLVGPPTHVHGYSVGPAFYWILWTLRVVTGPFFHNLPHGGGIGQAALQSSADALLLVGLWRRTTSLFTALVVVTLLATAPFDLALAAVVWNPVVGSILAKGAIALVLLDWHRGSLGRAAVVAAVGWCAVQAYTGALFVASGVFVALLAESARAGGWAAVRRCGLVIVGTVVVLQVPWMIHQWTTGLRDTGMTAVLDSLAGVFTGQEAPRVGASATALVDAFVDMHALSGPKVFWALALGASVVTVAIRYRSDAQLLAVTILPIAAAVVGFAFWLQDVESYFLLPLAPAVVITVVLAAAAVVPKRLATAAGALLLAGALAVAPARAAIAAGLFRLPEYSALASGAKQIASLGQPIRSIDPAFDLPPGCNAEFLFVVLGGRLDPQAPWRAIIRRDGRVDYIRTGAGGL
jgi:hypothetical protein